VCGAPAAVEAADVAAGWYPCRCCGSAAPIDATGTVAIEAPFGRAVCIARPGLTRIEEPLGHPFLLLPLVAALDLALGAFLWLMDQAAPSAHVVVAPVVNLLVLLSVAAAAAALQLRHVIEIEPAGVRAFWQWRDRRFHERVGSPAAALRIARGFRFRDPRDLPFVERCVTEALEHAGSQRPAALCPGCGAPVSATGNEGAVADCVYCGSSLVLGRATLRLGPLERTPLPAAAGEAVPLRSRTGPDADAAVFVLPSFVSRHGNGSAFGALIILAPFILAPMAGAAVALLDGGLLPATRVLAALYCAAFSAALAFGAALVFWGENPIQVDRHAITWELRLFGRRLRSVKLPIARLTRIDVGLDDGAGARVRLALRTPTRSFSLDQPQQPPEGARFLRAVVDALEPALRRAGRL
jgi:hypothetical protein